MAVPPPPLLLLRWQWPSAVGGGGNLCSWRGVPLRGPLAIVALTHPRCHPFAILVGSAPAPWCGGYPTRLRTELAALRRRGQVQKEVGRRPVARLPLR